MMYAQISQSMHTLEIYTMHVSVTKPQRTLLRKHLSKLGLLSMQDYMTYRIYVKSKNILTLQFL